MKYESTITSNNVPLTDLKKKLLIQRKQNKKFQAIKLKINKIIFIILFFFISYITYKNKNYFFKSKNEFGNNEDEYTLLPI